MNTHLCPVHCTNILLEKWNSHWSLVYAACCGGEHEKTNHPKVKHWMLQTHHKEGIPFYMLCLMMITSLPGYLIWVSPMCVCNSDICSRLGKLVRGTRVLITKNSSIYLYNVIYKLISLHLEIIEFSCCCHYSIWKPFPEFVVKMHL